VNTDRIAAPAASAPVVPAVRLRSSRSNLISNRSKQQMRTEPVDSIEDELAGVNFVIDPHMTGHQAQTSWWRACGIVTSCLRES
jgi:hypothetical protein